MTGDKDQDTNEARSAAVALAAEQGFTYWAAMGTILRGWALVMQGQGEQGLAQVRQGLAAGERVVVSANFLIDAESNLRAALKGFAPPDSAGGKPQPPPTPEGGKP